MHNSMAFDRLKRKTGDSPAQQISDSEKTRAPSSKRELASEANITIEKRRAE